MHLGYEPTVLDCVWGYLRNQNRCDIGMVRGNIDSERSHQRSPCSQCGSYRVYLNALVFLPNLDSAHTVEDILQLFLFRDSHLCSMHSYRALRIYYPSFSYRDIFIIILFN